MEHLRNIKEMEQIFQSLPEEYRYLPFFGNILKFEYEKAFDYEKWQDVHNVNLLLSDEAELHKIQLYLKNVHGDISFRVSESLSGLAICDMKEYGYEPVCRFRVYDFENGDFSLYCEDIEVALVKD